MSIIKKSVVSMIACSFIMTSSSSFSARPSYEPVLELLHSIQLRWIEQYPDSDALTIEVTSNGCTTKDSFRAHLADRRGVSYFEVYRVIDDPCTEVPFKVEYSYTHEEFDVTKSQSAIISNQVRRFQVTD